MDGQHGGLRVADHFLSNAPDEQVRESRASLRRHDDQICATRRRRNAAVRVADDDATLDRDTLDGAVNELREFAPGSGHVSAAGSRCGARSM